MPSFARRSEEQRLMEEENETGYGFIDGRWIVDLLCSVTEVRQQTFRDNECLFCQCHSAHELEQMNTLSLRQAHSSTVSVAY